MKKQRFSLRKCKLGLVSVLVGSIISFAGTSQVFAEQVLENAAVNQTVEQVTSAENTLEGRVNSQPQQEEVKPQSEGIQAVDNVQSNESSENQSQQVSATLPTAEETAPSVSNVETEEIVEAPASETSTSESSQDTNIEVVEQEQTDKNQESLAPRSLATPLDNDSNSMISAPTVWETAYKGEGSIVAIIDSGLDVEHDVLKITDTSKAKYQSEQAMEVAKTAAGISYGKWFSDKVVFGYNYADGNDVLKEADSQSHGMHVTGIAAGNPSNMDGGRYIQGVAPEAQVMFMRVFSDVNSTTGAALYVRAIEDAVKLGADSINLSLGGANGSLVNMDNTVLAAIELARKAGVSVVIAAGNDGAFGAGHSIPWSTNLDYGLVADPSTAKDAISVASYNNSVISQRVLNIVGLEDNADLNFGRSSYDNPDRSEKKFEIGKAYDYVYAGLGQEEDFTGLDLTGKLALIKRGTINFSSKISNATKAGAEGVVIFNNVPGEENIGMALDETAIAIPSVFIPAEFGEALAANAYKIQFNNESETVANPEAGQMSAFSSWGLSADGELKPDIAAPGGSIYSAINDNQYASQSGTSMAAPHVAGAAVLVKQYLKDKFPDKSAAELETLVKQLLMSTAKTHFDTLNQVYSSPRQQGAGMLDVAAAVSTDLFVTGLDSYPSLTLGNVGDQFEFTVEVHNISSEDKVLNYTTHVNTDQTYEGLAVLVSRELMAIPGQEITVKANSSQQVTIKVDASEFSEMLLQEMPNGYFLEGFVRFTDPVDAGELISIPYVAFRGEFQNLPVVETPIYQLLPEGQVGFYFTPNMEELLEVKQDQDFTGLLTNYSEKVYSTDRMTEEEMKVLGAFKNDKDQFVLSMDETGQLKLAISPNGDNIQDSVLFKGVFLRNYTNLVASIYAADDVEQTNALWTSKAETGEKNYYSGNELNPKSTVVYPTEWSGLDKSGNPLADGNYKYVLTYLPEVPGADVQKLEFDVIVDRQAPSITTATYDANSFTFNPRPATEKGPAGIFRERVFYLLSGENGLTTLTTTDEKGHVTVTDNKVFVAQNEDGSFSLPLDLADISKFYYIVEDFAGNVSSEKVENLIGIGNGNGLVTVNLLDQATKEDAQIDFSYIVRDQNGQVVNELPRYAENASILKLPFGTYSIELFLYDTEWSSLSGENKFTVTISEENSVGQVDFYVLAKEKASLLVDVDKLLPAGTNVNLVTADGQSLALPNAKYSKTDYGKFVPVGQYTIATNLPEGYEFYEDLNVDVLVDQVNRKQLTLIDKRALSNLLTELATIEETATYYNADSLLQAEFIKVLKEAQLILANKHLQNDVDQAIEGLTKAKLALNGQATDTSALVKELEAYQLVAGQAVYYNASDASKIAYDTAIRLAQLALGKEQTSQKEIDQVLSNLQASKSSLDGLPTDIRALRNAVSLSTVVRTTDAKYLNASKMVKQTYDQALAKAKAVLADENASQVSVDQALAELQAAQVALDGVASPTSENQSPENTESNIKPDEKATPPPVEPSLPSEEKPGNPVQPSLPASEKQQEVVENTHSSKVDTTANVSPIQSPTPSHQLSSDKNQAPSFTVVAPANHPVPQSAIRQDTAPTQKMEIRGGIVVASSDKQLPNTSSKDESAYLFLGIALVTTVFLTQKKKDESI
ncbi:TPA: S8 family serine peptidase [Streptococcus suis]